MSRGQSVVDRLTAAKHTVIGAGLAKSVCKATTEEIIGPKKKHLDYLIQCTNEPNVSIPSLANTLIDRTQNSSWAVTYKALISIHNLMNYGNERFTQYLASNNCTFNLGSFIDKSSVQGYDMSTFIRRYAKYINEKAISYRQMAFDFCKVKRGKEDGMLRSMVGDKLLKTLPVLQTQIDALLEFDCTSNELTNGIINASFLLLFKDLIRLFACYNDGIINLLEKYFEMNKKQCKEALDIYKRFLVRMDKVAEFLKVAENVGIDKGDIPDLAKAPSSLLEALESHLNSFDKKGISAHTGPVARPTAVQSAINTLASTVSANQISEDERQRILDEEKRKLQQLKEQQLRQSQPSSPATATAPAPAPVNQVRLSPQVAVQAVPAVGVVTVTGAVPVPAPATQTGPNLFGDTPQNQALSQEQSKPSVDLDLLNLNSTPFQQQIHSVMAMNTAVNAMQSPSSGYAGQQNATWGTQAPASNGFATDSAFAAAFGAPTTGPQSGFDGFGDVLQPDLGSAQQQQQNDKLITDASIDNSLSNLASNLHMNGPAFQVKKTQHEWKPKGESKMTGGTNFQQMPRSTATTTWQPPVQQPAMSGMMAPQMNAPMSQAGFQPQPPAYGMAMQQQPMGFQPGYGAPVYGGQQPGNGGMPMVQGQPVGAFQQPPASMLQPNTRPSNDPFGAL